jgi:hypothetical protein
VGAQLRIPNFRLPWILLVITLIVVGAAGFLMASTASLDIGVEPAAPAQRWIELATAATTSAAGAVILSRNIRNVIGWLFMALGLAVASTQLSVSYAASCETATNCNLGLLVITDGIWFPMLTIGVGGLFLLFPEGRIPTGGRRYLWWGLLTSGLAGALSTLVLEEVYHLAGARNPWAAGFDQGVVTIVSDLAGVAVVLVSMVAVVDFIFRARKATGIARLQNRWLAWSGLILLVGAVVSILGEEIGLEMGWAWAAGTATIPVAVAFAITQNRLYEIDRILSRTVSYALVVALLILAVAGIAATVGAQFKEPWVVAATTLGVAAFFNPARRRMQLWVDRRFNRSRYDAQRVMDEFAGSLRDRVDSDEVVQGWLGVVDATMQPETIGVWLRV